MRGSYLVREFARHDAVSSSMHVAVICRDVTLQNMQAYETKNCNRNLIFIDFIGEVCA